ncbi:hypothetical protein [Paractinoplanes durhamensis]|uniref:hypothetical protein n=1 Tax=Paractinoplanes durhamensis TaxID=113563 RepID=UPI00363C73BC
MRTNLGYQAGTVGYRRVCLALFAAGVATFALLYSTQAVLPELAGAFRITPARPSGHCRWRRSASASRC